VTDLFKNHGTKILGALVAVIGALGDVQQLFVAVDPNPRHIALYSLIVALGSAVIRRGFSNTAATVDTTGSTLTTSEPGTLAPGDTIKVTEKTASKSGPPPIGAWLIFFIVALPLVLGLVACQSLSFQEQLAAAYGTYTTVERAADQAYVSGSLPKAQALQAQALAKQVRPFLDAAQAASTSGDSTGASQDLELATTALGALQRYVDSQLPAQKGK
jgi:hypothetical protein